MSIQMVFRVIGKEHVAVVGLLKTQEEILQDNTMIAVELRYEGGDMAGFGILPGYQQPMTKDHQILTVGEMLRQSMWQSGSEPGCERSLFYVRKSQLFEGEEGHRYMIVSAMKNNLEFTKDSGLSITLKKQTHEHVMWRGDFNEEDGRCLIEREIMPKGWGRGETMDQLATSPIWLDDEGQPFRLNTTHTDEVRRQYAAATSAAIQGKDVLESIPNADIAVSVLRNTKNEDYLAYLKCLHPDGVVSPQEFLVSEEEHAKARQAGRDAVAKSMLERGGLEP